MAEEISLFYINIMSNETNVVYCVKTDSPIPTFKCASSTEKIT